MTLLRRSCIQLYATSLYLLTLQATSLSAEAVDCIEFNIPITASATNKLIYSPTYDLTTPDGVTSFLGSGIGIFSQAYGDISQSGTFPMSARYCPPQPNKSAPKERANHVQLLLHGIPYNKNYWNGLYFPEGASKYSWVDYATSQGYPVLSIDNLGNGNSTAHPDPILTVQQPLETEIFHQIALKLRAGSIPHVPKAKKLIWVSHSYASVIGNALASKYPDTINAFILTGYTYTIAQAVPGVLLDLIEPAQVYSPARYGSLAPGYLTFGSESGKRQSYYAADGTFDPSLAHFDFLTQGVTSVGEIVTFFAGLEKAANFTGETFVITGQEDALFCGTGSRTLGPQSCGKGANSVPARTKSFWPSANYAYYMPPGTSHATDLSHASQNVFKQAHQFLASNDY